MNSITLLSDARYFDEGSTRVSELRALLDSRFPREKLDAMKRLLAMMTLGRDVSSFFPDVVKNVVVEHMEVKKLVYMYLIHYAEEKQDLALLTINSFQKDLQNHSQRIRANAMRAMASIRLPVAIPLVMIALKTAVKDNSSYVRRAAASAIPKVASCEGLEPDQHDMLVEFIVELLGNTEPIVLGAAMFAFQEVCPDRMDLLHPHYRKICHLLADFDDWGQQVAIEILLRYGRTQFLSPFSTTDNNEINQEKEKFLKALAVGCVAAVAERNGESHMDDAFGAADAKDSKDKEKDVPKSKVKKPLKEKSFYSDDDDSDGGSDASSAKQKKKKAASKKKAADDDDSGSEDEALRLKIAASAASRFSGNVPSSLDEMHLDEDHRLLLKQTALLLQTSNSGVLLSLVSLYWHLAPTSELVKVIRPLVRMSRNRRSIMYVILCAISTMASVRPELFRPYLKDFFANSTDPNYVRELKLDIICHLATEATMVVILKEFQAYCWDADKDFVCKVIQSIGRCIQYNPDIAERAMSVLSSLVVSPTDSVVAQSVVVIVRQLLPFSPAASVAPIVKRMTRLLDQVRIPMARTAIVWMIGEYREHIPQYAPDALRKLSKSFQDEDISVKLQVLNLAVKLFLFNPKQTSLLFKYIMDLSKYDTNYDLRDRARLFRSLFFKKKVDAEAGATLSPAAQQALGAPGEQGTEIKDNLKSVLLGAKPTPNIPEPFALRTKYRLGSLSHVLAQPAASYLALPDFPLVAPDPTVRQPKPSQRELDEAEREKSRQQKKDKKKNKQKKTTKKGSGSDEEASVSVSGSGSGSGVDTDDDNSDSEKSSDFSSFGSESENSSNSDDSNGSGSDDDSASGSGSGSSKSGSDAEDSEEDKRTKEKEKDRDLEAAESDSDDEKEKEKLAEAARRRAKALKDNEKEMEKLRKKKDKAKKKGKGSDVDEDDDDEEENDDNDDDDELDMSHQSQTAAAAKARAKEMEKEKAATAAAAAAAAASLSSSKGNKGGKEEKSSASKSSSKTAPKAPEPADLLDFSAMNLGSPSSSASGGAASPSSASATVEAKTLDLTTATPLELKNLFPKYGHTGVVLNPIHSGGLQIEFYFSRKPSLYSKVMNAIDLRFTNQSNNAFTELQLLEENASLKADSVGLDEVGTAMTLNVGDSNDAKIHVAFKGKADTRTFALFVGTQKHALKLSATVGELLRPHLLSHTVFADKQKKLSGMQETSLTVACGAVEKIPYTVCAVFNVAPMAQHAQHMWRFAADLLHDDSIVLLQCTVKDLSLTKGPGQVVVQVNCEDFMLAGHLVELAKKALAAS